MGNRNRSQSDSGGSAWFAILVVIALLWWLRWAILAGLLITGAVLATRWLLRRQAAHRATEAAHLNAIRTRAEIENSQVLRGDPAGFFGQYGLPDPELIPEWYRLGGDTRGARG